MKRDPALVRLSRDHNRGLVLSLYVERTLPGADDSQLDRMQREIVDFWQTALLPHFRAECECLLARLVRHAALSDDMVRRTEDDHLRVNSIMALLRDADDVAVRRALIAELGTLLKDHIRWEESTLFEASQRLLGAGELDAVGADIAQRLPAIPPPAPAPWNSPES
jgi:Hemerythrin HHE cation binding domain